ncbi:hypothetical protein BDDG_11769 [Blastomyces dermatitidis ATCC 18188]|uniref:Uncharacterized protein n=1 Tax=Ajellomyces dermatitidis (strain ATCC 18188 / CBS 674.68) TaxID=653446 RepID=A0A0J9HCU4_AJEDA|nr:hypothetical protein BDDG_11769 [Blastomyces dermatitidis ATCC 18188]
MKKLQNSADSIQQHSEQGSGMLREGNYKLSFSESLSLESSSLQVPLQMTTQDHTSLRRDNTSLQGTATSTVAAREAGEDVMMRAVLLQLIDVTAFNLAFLTVTEAAAAP